MRIGVIRVSSTAVSQTNKPAQLQTIPDNPRNLTGKRLLIGGKIMDSLQSASILEACPNCGQKRRFFPSHDLPPTWTITADAK